MLVLSKYDGGRGLYIDDLKALQDQINQLRLFTLSGDSYILGGCSVSGNTLEQGLVRLGGGFVYVPQQTLSQFPAFLRRGTSLGEQPRFYDLDQGNFDAFTRIPVEVVYSDPGGDRIRIDATGGYTYQDYLAELFDIAGINTTLDTKAAQSSVNTLSSNKADKALSTGWTNISLPSHSTIYDNSGSQTFTFTPATPQYSKDSFGFVHLRGHLSYDDGGQSASTTPAFTLPGDFRPGADHVFITRRLDDSGDVTLFLGSDGKLKRAGIPVGSAIAFSLDHIHFYAG